MSKWEKIVAFLIIFGFVFLTYKLFKVEKTVEVHEKSLTEIYQTIYGD